MFKITTIILTASIILSGSISSAQRFSQDSTAISTERQADLTRLLLLIRDDRINELATQWVAYPLRRSNPLPDIKNPNEFILHYDNLFDSAFKFKLLSTEYSTDNTIEDATRGNLGILWGEMWLNDDGKICTINHESQADSLLQVRLIQEFAKTVHESVRGLIRNGLVWESEKHLVRVDELDSGYRYVSWSKPKDIKDAPDLIIYGGEIVRQGTMGGWTYNFKNGEWMYVLDDVQIAEDDLTGLFLRIYHNGTLKASYRCRETK